MGTKYLVIDTETTGLFNFALPADAPGQPRMASVAMIFLGEDLKVEREYAGYVQPDGWEMSAEASKINGLTTEFLKANGRPVGEALKVYTDAVDAGYVVLAFNSQYDTKILRGELRRAGIADRFENTPNSCMMKAATPMTKIAGARGFKFPKLAEACGHFGIAQDAQHSALGDARACAAILVRLIADKACPEPAVHYAKNRPSADNATRSGTQSV
jgi:DNA polymerase III epsilon subunit-like protein